MYRIAINGFGRVGRCALRQISKMEDYEVVAINDLTDSLQLAYLYKYDSIHRTLDAKVGYDDDEIEVNNKKINIYCEKDPSKLPWKKLKIDLVLECSGAFTSKESCKAHIKAGAKRVIISAPAKDDCKTIVFGVNENEIDLKDKIISTASCTTNCLAPICKIINDEYKIKSGFMTTVHAMTNDQETLDIPHKKGIESRRGRAASLNIVPTSTGAAKALGNVIPELKGKLDGIAYRVPVSDGSLIDLNVIIDKKVTSEKVNEMFKKYSSDIVKIVNVPLVSSDVIGTTNGAIIDGILTNVISTKDSTMLKISAWYDNEWGYTAQMLRVMDYWCNLK